MKRRDFQRSRVYRWEHETYGNHPLNQKNLSLDECRQLMIDVLEKLPHMIHDAEDFVNCIEISDGRGCRRALSFGGRIALPRWARQTYVVLHELAHELHRYEEHRQAFVRTYTVLLAVAFKRKVEMIRMEAEDYGIKWR